MSGLYRPTMNFPSSAVVGPVRSRRGRRRSLAVVGGLLLLTGCSRPSAVGDVAIGSPPPSSASPTGQVRPSASGSTALAGMPAVLDPDDVWAADRPGQMSPVVKGMPSRIYVPNSEGDTVSIIDPATYKVLRTVKVGRQPQHVVPSWDLKTLWVNNDLGDSLTPINPRTGHFGKPVPVSDPYNLYFTPDGRSAVVMASEDRRIVFRDPHTMAVQKSVRSECDGVNHADFSADGRYFLVSCEFDGQLLKVDTARRKIVGRIQLPPRAMMPKPQDVKLSADGKVFYVADMMSDGIWLINGKKMKVTGFISTGKGAHGLYVTRDSKKMLISNRDEGSISVLNLATRKLVDKWWIPGGGSPDMGGISANGKVFWVSGRYNSEVYAISTVDGHLIKRIKVGFKPHGLAVYPQPGRYSMGHTGIFR
jgi:YVTN family beta-propeller protein